MKGLPIFRRSLKPADIAKSSEINFRTDTRDHGQRALGVGVYEAAIPNQAETILFDGEPVKFQNPETVNRVFKAASGVELLRKKGTMVSCYVFAGLFQGTVQLDEIPKSKELWYDFTAGDEPVRPEDVTDGQVLAIGAQFHDMDQPLIYHSLVAAETPEDMVFFHVLGDEGPLALSGLDEALRTFKSTHIRNFSDFRIRL